MNASAYDIFDCHQHVGGVFGIPGMAPTGSSGAAGFGDDYKTRIDVMDRCGVHQAMLMPGHSYMKPRGIADTRAINDGLASYRRLDPRRIPIISGTVEPRYGADGLAEIERMHFELNFQAVSWHHRQQGLPMDHPIMYTYISRMGELGLVPMIHCMIDSDFEDHWRFQRLVLDFPEVTFLCLDGMTHPELFEALLAIGARAPNILFDTTSSVLGTDGVRKCVERLGPTRLLFGTNLYSRMQPRRLHELDSVIAADIPESAKHLILGGNARKLFKVAAN